METENRRVTRSIVRKSVSENNESRRKNHQEQLSKSLINEMIAKYKYALSNNSSKNSRDFAVNIVSSFRSDSQFPKESMRGITMDKKHNCIFFPFNHIPFPIHISYIKSVSRSEESGISYIRFNFTQPTQQLQNDYKQAFLKELTFRCKSQSRSQEIFKDIILFKKEYTEMQSLSAIPIIKQPDLIKRSNSKHNFYF